MKQYPAWKVNIFIFVTIAAMIGGYSFWQVQRAEKQFLENSREHARVVAAVVELTLDPLWDDREAGQLLARLNRLPGIASIALQRSPVPSRGSEPVARLVLTEGRRLTETVIPLAGRNLVVALPAGHFAKRMQQMKGEFFLFAVSLLFFGCLSTWWLYHSQQRRIQEARDFERQIARQHEEAALGRAAATITHEIRNPLNAIGMGLQRLEIEASRLEPDHLDLVASMREAVARSNAIVSDLQRYVGGFLPMVQSVDITGLLTEVMGLYRVQCDLSGIDLSCKGAAGLMIEGDRRLLGQLFENLLKNAVESQPDGGRIAVSVEARAGICRLVFENDGFTLGPQESGEIFEPYFSTKSRGTGLGLAISKKIVEAHGGKFVWQPDLERHIFRLLVELPLRQQWLREGERQGQAIQSDV